MSQSATTPSPPPISVLVLTRNEQFNIADCLRSCAFSDDIVVLDSGSIDQTVAIARRFPNVRIVERAFDTEFRQRNFGLHDIDYKHPWVYVCDADERVPRALAEEMIATVGDPRRSAVAYRLRYKNMFRGKWIRHATPYPSWIIRLMRPDKVRYEERATNVHPIADGPVGELQGHFIHHSFNSGLRRWLAKHNDYSTQEAIEGVKQRAAGRPSWEAMRDVDPMARRRALKNFSYFLRARALWRFLHAFVLSGGWRDGSAGLHYCLMISMYEYWMELKMKERERDWVAETDALADRLLSRSGGGA